MKENFSKFIEKNRSSNFLNDKSEEERGKRKENPEEKKSVKEEYSFQNISKDLKNDIENMRNSKINKKDKDRSLSFAYDDENLDSKILKIIYSTEKMMNKIENSNENPDQIENDKSINSRNQSDDEEKSKNNNEVNKYKDYSILLDYYDITNFLPKKRNENIICNIEKSNKTDSQNDEGEEEKIKNYDNLLNSQLSKLSRDAYNKKDQIIVLTEIYEASSFRKFFKFLKVSIKNPIPNEKDKKVNQIKDALLNLSIKFNKTLFDNIPFIEISCESISFHSILLLPSKESNDYLSKIEFPIEINSKDLYNKMISFKSSEILKIETNQKGLYINFVNEYFELYDQSLKYNNKYTNFVVPTRLSSFSSSKYNFDGIFVKVINVNPKRLFLPKIKSYKNTAFIGFYFHKTKLGMSIITKLHYHIFSGYKNIQTFDLFGDIDDGYNLHNQEVIDYYIQYKKRFVFNLSVFIDFVFNNKAVYYLSDNNYIMCEESNYDENDKSILRVYANTTLVDDVDDDCII